MNETTQPAPGAAPEAPATAPDTAPDAPQPDAPQPDAPQPGTHPDPPQPDDAPVDPSDNSPDADDEPRGTFEQMADDLDAGRIGPDDAVRRLFRGLAAQERGESEDEVRAAFYPGESEGE